LIGYTTGSVLRSVGERLDDEAEYLEKELEEYLADEGETN